VEDAGNQRQFCSMVRELVISCRRFYLLVITFRLSYSTSVSTVEKANVRRCRKIVPPQTVALCSGGCRFGFRDAPRGVRPRPPAGSAAAAATDGRSAATSAAGSGCPRLIGGAARLSNLAATKRGTGERQGGA